MNRAVRRLAFGVLATLLAGCGGGAVRAPVGERAPQPPAAATAARGFHVVRSGESLFSIAWQYGLDYRRLARWNGIRPPYLIHPGQRLRLRPPAGGSRHESRVKGREPVSRRALSPRQSKTERRTARTESAARERAAKREAKSAGGALRWTWPADGPILRRFDPRRPGRKGIRIGGRPGDPVRAAAAGRVVYSGSGLVGYGRLIIIKHNNRYLSAYGHNRELLVKEGDVVRRGQVIARLGSSGTNRPMLHFEIRRNGRPVDPLRYLPRRR